MPKTQVEDAGKNNRKAISSGPALKGYAAFPDELRTKDHIRAGIAEGHRPRRTAVLVVHGIGAQKPYETLDQFARGILGFFRGTPGASLPTQEVRLRQHKANLNTNQQDWTQAFVRVRPDVQREDRFDIYEYYWAPVITDRVSALQSLKFLILAGLSPFQYLRDNLAIINRAHPTAGSWSKVQWLVFAFFRELIRMLLIFIPTITVLLGLYWLITMPIANLAFSESAKSVPKFFTHPVNGWMALKLVSFSMRALLTGMCVIFLLQELMARRKGAASERSPLLYVLFIAAYSSMLIFIPYALHGHLRLQARADDFLRAPASFRAECIVGGLIVLLGLSFTSKILRSAWRRARKTVKRQFVSYILAFIAVAGTLVTVMVTDPMPFFAAIGRFLVLPEFINWRGVAFYTFLALASYVVRRFLTTGVGCLAVYLGSDDLSKNFAARSQILHECTAMLIDLLSGLNEAGEADPEWDYDEVLIAGHSLGSVIAYDSLTELIVRKLALDPALAKSPLDKIKGLLTFGCPLNKVVYFFRTRVNLQTNVLSQILYMLHPFRLRTALPPEANPAIAIPHPFPVRLHFSQDFKWFNAYSPFDIISGRMQFYNADLDVPVEQGVAPWTAHLSYWENDDLYSLFSHLL